MRPKILINTHKDDGGGRSHHFYCPGCKRGHAFWIGGGTSWSWNSDRERPTVQPSIRVFLPGDRVEPEETLCHLFIRDGQIDFLNDSKHELAGQVVPLADWPEDYGTAGLE